VLATLVKKMEEHKDELVVIMAGYSDEMENMIALNPGLTSRVPHQIHFKDYSAEELYLIFKQQLGKEYKVEERSSKHVERYICPCGQHNRQTKRKRPVRAQPYRKIKNEAEHQAV